MRSEKAQRAIYVGCDYVMANLAFLCFNILRYFRLPKANIFPSLKHYLCSDVLLTEQVLFPMVIIGIFTLSGYYNNVLQKSRLQELFTTVSSCFVSALVLYFALLTNDQLELRSTNYLLVLAIFGLLFGFVYICRYILTSITLHNYRRGKWGINTLVIGNTANAHELVKRLANPGLGYREIGYVRLPGEQDASDSQHKPTYSIDEIEEVCQRHEVRMIVLAPELNREDVTLKMLTRLFPLNLPIKIQPDTLSILTSGIRLNNIYEEPMLDISHGYVSESTRNIKRTLDVLISGVALIVLSLPMLIVGLCVKADSNGPMFYRQPRVGYRRKIFNILKFRTMYTDAEANGPRLSSADDPRITKLGRVLRKYRIDELPQLFNVLRGDMSLVGPRPERQYFIDKIMERAPWYILVHQVRPGITSWGMVRYGYAENVDQMISRLKYDIVYLENISVSTDMKIILSTVKTVLTGKGK